VPQQFGQLAEWGTRFLGRLVDGALSAAGVVVIYLVGALLGVIVFGIAGADEDSATVVGIIMVVVLGLLYLALIAFNIWNVCYRRGTTGQTIGQKVAKIKTISEETGQPIGFGGAFLRELCHILDGIACYIGWLAPLWEQKKQTWADKICKTVVVHVDQVGAQPAVGFGPQPGAYPPPGTPGGGFPGQQPPGYGQPPQQW
jgi:uncharacterized RDD family membrane protein YckC